MEYKIIKIDKKEIEYNFINCDTCKIYLNGFLIGRYNFAENEYIPAIDEWYSIDKFALLTKRQQKLVLIGANRYFLKIYKNIYFEKLKNGDFFAPTDETLQQQKYYFDKINKCIINIEILKGA